MTSGYLLWGAPGGTLSTNNFTIDDVAYRVLFILHHADGVYLGMTGEIPTDFVLRIGDAAFAARESSVPNTAAAYRWADQTFTWTPGETFQVSITPVRDLDQRYQSGKQVHQWLLLDWFPKGITVSMPLPSERTSARRSR